MDTFSLGKLAFVDRGTVLNLYFVNYSHGELYGLSNINHSSCVVVSPYCCCCQERSSYHGVPAICVNRVEFIVEDVMWIPLVLAVWSSVSSTSPVNNSTVAGYQRILAPFIRSTSGYSWVGQLVKEKYILI